jgi:hypothetical protein
MKLMCLVNFGVLIMSRAISKKNYGYAKQYLRTFIKYTKNRNKKLKLIKIVFYIFNVLNAQVLR